MRLENMKVHFIGIGGIGMSGIAEVLINMGARVSGSDLAANAQVEHLAKLGARIFRGHAPSHVPEQTDVVVYSSAVSPSNPEITAARLRKVPVIPRAEMLAELMRLKRGIAVAGSHGKTTTTSLIASIMLAAHMDPTIVVGGRLDFIKSTAALGKGDWLLAEADESDGSFLKLSPEHVVITNIDNDHLDHYGDFANLKSAFAEFAERIPFYGCGVFCADDDHVMELAKRFNKPRLLYGLSARAELKAVNIRQEGVGQSFDLFRGGEPLGRLRLNFPGRHNVLNSLAAIGIGLQLGLDMPIIAQGLLHFQGVDRRLQTKGEYNGALVIDDYGHHPTEVSATLQSLKEAYPRKKLVVVFQPHRYSRTQSCWEQFINCFGAADDLVLLDIYAAGEAPLPGVSSEKLCQQISVKHQSARHLKGTRETVIEYLRLLLDSQHVLVTLGAGDVSKLGPELLATVEK